MCYTFSDGGEILMIKLLLLVLLVVHLGFSAAASAADVDRMSGQGTKSDESKGGTENTHEPVATPGGSTHQAHQPSEQEKRLIDAVSEARKLKRGDPRLTQALVKLDEYYANGGDQSRREAVLQQLVETYEAAFPPDYHNLANFKLRQAKFFESVGRKATAEHLFKQALDIYVKAYGEDHPLTAEAAFRLGVLCENSGKFVESEKFLRQSLDAWDKSLGAENMYSAHALRMLSSVMEGQSRLAEATEAYKRAALIRSKIHGGQFW